VEVLQDEVKKLDNELDEWTQKQKTWQREFFNAAGVNLLDNDAVSRALANSAANPLFMDAPMDQRIAEISTELAAAKQKLAAQQG
jgi:uncharacterized membrane protein